MNIVLAFLCKHLLTETCYNYHNERLRDYKMQESTTHPHQHRIESPDNTGLTCEAVSTPNNSSIMIKQ